MKGVKRKLSKLYDIYVEKKKENREKIYLFKNGNFYLMLGKDAKKMSEELGLKLTSFSKETEKCGFPISEYERYIKFIRLLGYETEIIQSEIDQIIGDISSIDIDHLNGKTAIDKIIFYQKLLINN